MERFKFSEKKESTIRTIPEDVIHNCEVKLIEQAGGSMLVNLHYPSPQRVYTLMRLHVDGGIEARLDKRDYGRITSYINVKDLRSGR